MKKNIATKASIGYTVGNYCIKGIGFITVPIFTRVLSTSDYGIYNTFLAYEAILYIFISLALHSSLKNAKYKFEGAIDQYTSSVSVLPQIVAIVVLLIAIAFHGSIASALKIEPQVIYLLVLYSYCSGLTIYYQSRIALDYKYKEYLSLSAFSVISNVGLSLVLIHTAFDAQRYMGRILGGTVTYALMAEYILFRLWRKSKPKVNIDYWRYGLKISLPIIPHGLAQILLLQFDRIMINSMVGSSESGLYSFAYTIYSLVQITTTSLDTVYSPWVFKQLKERNAVKEVRNIATCFMLIIAGIVTGTMLLSPEIVLLLGGEKYTASLACVSPVLLAGFFAMAYCIPSVMEYYHEKTKFIALGTSLAAVMNITLNAIFIPKYGYVAAAYTTLASYIMYFLLHVFISKAISGYYIIKTGYLVGAVAIILAAFIGSFIFVNLMVVRIVLLVILVSIGVHMLVSAYGYESIYKILNDWKGREKQ